MIKSSLLLFLGLIFIYQSFGATIYVDIDATGSNNGSSWPNAYTSLNSALSNASNGDDIWIAEGTYKPGSVRGAYFDVPSGVDLYGGFAGTESALSQRVLGQNETIISGEVGSASALSDNSYNLVTLSGNSKITIDRISFKHAYGSSDGGAINFESNSSVTLVVEDCNFIENQAYQGGAIYMESPNNDIEIIRCTFTGNKASVSGGAVCLESDNYVNGEDDFWIEDCLFKQNDGGSLGGAIYFREADRGSRIVHSKFYENEAILGGAICNINTSYFEIYTCAFANNDATVVNGIGQGGAIFSFSGSIDIYSSSFGNNVAGKGGAIANAGTVFTYKNSIFWGNTSTETDANDEIENLNLRPTSYAYNCIFKDNVPLGIDANRRLNENPNFSSAGNNNLNLLAGSAAIDAGGGYKNGKDHPFRRQNWWKPDDPTDLNGNERFVNVKVDIGAYEYGANPVTSTIYDRDFGTTDIGPSFGDGYRFSYNQPIDEFEGYGESVLAKNSYVIIGSPKRKQAANGGIASNTGIAWVRNSKGVTAPLEHPFPNTDAQLGKSLGFSKYFIAAGAPGDAVDNSGTASVAGGAVYLYEKASPYDYKLQLVASDRNTNDAFGSAIAMNDDYIIVGAPAEDEDASGNNTLLGAGSVYVFQRTGTGFSSSWNQVQKIVSPNRETSGAFGSAISIDNNVLAVSAPNENNGKGKVYTYVLSSGSFSYVSTISPNDLSNDDGFGTSLEFNQGVLMIGAPYQDLNVANVGVVYQYEYASSAFTQAKKIFPPYEVLDGNFGASVSHDENVLAIAYPCQSTSNNSNYNAAGLARVIIYFDPTHSHSDFQYKTQRSLDIRLPNEAGAGDQIKVSVNEKGVYYSAPKIDIELSFRDSRGNARSQTKENNGAVYASFKKFRSSGLNASPPCISDVSDETSDGLTLWWSGRGYSKTIIVANEFDNAPDIPIDSTTYNNANSTYGEATAKLGSNSYIVYNGDGNSVAIDGLTSNTKYQFTAYGYNEGQNGWASRVYVRSKSLTKEFGATIDEEPTTTSTLTEKSGQSDENKKTEVIYSVSRGNGDKYMVIRGANMPKDGVRYSGDGSVDLTGCLEQDENEEAEQIEILYIGDESEVTFNRELEDCGSTAEETRTYTVVEFNDLDGLPNYYIEDKKTVDVTFLEDIVTFTDATHANKVEIISKSCTKATAQVTGGNDFTAFDLYDVTNSKLIYSDGTSPSLENLEAGTDYKLTAKMYVEDCGGSPVYPSTGTAPFVTFTTNTGCTPAAEPTTHTSNISDDIVRSTYAELSFTKGNGAKRLVIVSKDKLPTFVPVDQTEYYEGQTVGNNEWIEAITEDAEVTIYGGPNLLVNPDQDYYVKVFEFNGGDDAQNYLTTGTPGSFSFKTIDAKIWGGDDSENWQTGNNWLLGSTPGLNDHVIIDAGSNDPSISSDLAVKSLNVEEGASLTIEDGRNLSLTGDFQNLGARDLGSGTLVLSGSGNQVIKGAVEINNLTVNNSNSLVFEPLNADDVLYIKGNLNLQSGDLNIGSGTLIIDGTVTGTGEVIGGADASIIIGGNTNQSVGSLSLSSTSNTINSITIDRSFSGNPGSIQITSDLHISNFLSLNNGYIEADNSQITIGDEVTVTGGGADSYIRLTNGGTLLAQTPSTGSVTLPLGRNPYLPIVIDNGGGTEFTVSVAENLYEDPTDINSTLQTADAVGETWTITAAQATNNVDVTTQWNEESELADFEKMNAFLLVWEDGVSTIWDEGNSAIASGTGPYSLTRTIDFTTNTFYFGVVSSGSALPVSLTYFSTQWKEVGQSAELNWQTALEENNSHFELERSFDATSWEKVGRVEGQGNTLATTDYQFIDDLLSPSLLDEGFRKGQTIYYRLKQVDFDGRFEYSDVRTLNNGSENELVLDVYPNPSSGIINLNTNMLNYTYTLYSLHGKPLLSGNNVNQINAGQLADGEYLLEVANDTEIVRERILLIKK